MSAGNWKEMFQAACDGDLELVEFHVRSGVDVNFVHPEFLGTALVASILEGRADVALFLLSQGADPRQLSELEGLRPLQAAERVQLKPVIAQLQAMGIR